jgi:hypothetical protein
MGITFGVMTGKAKCKYHTSFRFEPDLLSPVACF